MKAFAAVAIFAGLLALPVLAQRGTAHGSAGHAAAAPHAFSGGFGGHAFGGSGFAGHGPVGFRPGTPGGFRYGGFASRGPAGFRPGAPRFGQPSGPMRFGRRPQYAGAMPYRRFGGAPDHGRFSGESGDHDRDHHHRMEYFNGGLYPYWYGYPNYPIFTGYVDPWLFGPDDYDSADNQSPAYSGDNGQGYPEDEYPEGDQAPYSQDQYASPDYGPQQPSASARRPYTGPAQEPSSTEPSASTGGLASPAVTVIFKDGRPPEQIHNYLLTANTLTVFEPRYREIPLDQVNLPATEAANRESGVDFRPPGQ